MDSHGAAAHLEQFLAEHRDLERIELLFPDINGVVRGKWLPVSSARKLLSEGVRLPISTYALDIFGDDVDETGLALATGDPDGYASPVFSTLKRVPWSQAPAAQVLMQMQTADGQACVYDPRDRLKAVLSRFDALGLTPVVATELEFYLYQPAEDRSDAPVPPPGLGGSQVYELDATASLEPLLLDIRAFCAEQDIPTDTLIAEYGPGQFEVNFHHVPDALAAADYAVMFKRLVRATARKHGLAATFMAKPYGDPPGSGMHAHISLMDRNNRNVFASEDGEPAPMLRHAVGGVLATMRELQAIFAPHANSYRRFQPGSYAPTALTWGLDHRGVAVRLPETGGPGARLEHRITGADANPYLAIAAMLGGILHGIGKSLDPGPMLETGDGSEGDSLHSEWGAAVTEFAEAESASEIFGEEFVRVYAAMRRCEIARLSSMITDAEYRTYLHKL